MNNYILQDNVPIEEPDLHKWVLWFATADRKVRKTQVDSLMVSTVFLGMDHSFGFGGPPLLCSRR